MFVYCNNNPILFYDSTGFDAVILYDKDSFGHIGIMAQDEQGVWWHFYWGTKGGFSGSFGRLLCVLGFSLDQYTWCIEYSDSTISLNNINETNQYGGEYDAMHYLYGDFTSSVAEMKDPSGDYNLYTNNCSQVSLEILSKSNTSYSEILSAGADFILPLSTNSYLSSSLGRRYSGGGYAVNAKY